jgi:hypothetical protein
MVDVLILYLAVLNCLKSIFKTILFDLVSVMSCHNNTTFNMVDVLILYLAVLNLTVVSFRVRVTFYANRKQKYNGHIHLQ